MVTGMTCGSCAARIERRLNRLDGVSATVNYATGRAYFTSLGGREAAELIGVINSTGYQAALPAPADDSQRRRPRGQGPGPAARRLRPAGRSRHRAGDGACHPVHRLAVGEPAAGGPGRRMGRLAAAPGRAGRPWPCRGDDGHAGQPRGRRVLRLVGVRAAVRRRGHGGHADAVRVHLQCGQRADPLPRGRRGRHHRRARGPLPGGPREGSLVVGADRAGRTRCQERRRAARRSRAPGTGERTRARGGVRRPPGREDRHRRRRHRRAARPSTRPSSRGNPCPRRSGRTTRSPGAP